MNGLRFDLFGIPVIFEPGLGLLAGVFFLLGLSWGWELPLIVATIAVAVGSIFVHELGHATAARAFGLKVLSISLHGMGGVTRHQGSRSPFASLVVVLAGPMFGFGLAVAGLVLSLLSLPGLLGDVVQQLFVLNLVWSVFNLLPIFPLDGGNALSHLLQLMIPAAIAWPVTWGVGLVGAVGLGAGALALGETFVLLFAGMFGYQNFQMLQSWRAARRDAADQRG